MFSPEIGIAVPALPATQFECDTLQWIVPRPRYPILFVGWRELAAMEFVTTHGVAVPAVGFGTADMESEAEHRQLIDAALDAGYRHFDTAQRYGSETPLGNAIQASAVDREDLFITTKLDGPNRTREAVIESTKGSLDRLGTDYVDLLMNHWPNAENQPSDEVTINAMNDLRDDGFATNLGVANHSIEDLQNVIGYSDAPIIANQEQYSFLDRARAQGERGAVDGDLREFCIEHGVMYTAYSPLGQGEVLDAPKIVEIAERRDKRPVQIALRWLIQQPLVSAIPFSTSPEHIRANIDVFDFELTDDEMRELFAAREPFDDDLAAVFGL